MGDLPLVVLKDVNVGVSCLDDIAGSTHGEFVDTGILGPTITDANVAFDDLALRLLQKECIEVILDGSKVRARNIADGRKKDGFLGVALRHDPGIAGRKGVVPEREERSDLRLGDSFGDGAARRASDVDLAKLLLLAAEEGSLGGCGRDDILVEGGSGGR